MCPQSGAQAVERGAKLLEQGPFEHCGGQRGFLDKCGTFHVRIHDY